jgi:Undecaprenyl-phosphate galactose phosphotransferase WbaP
MNDFDFSAFYKKNFLSSSSFISGIFILLVDIVVLFLCIGFGFFAVNLFVPSSINFKSFVNYSFFIPIITLVYSFNGLYPAIMIPPTEQLKKISLSTFLCLLMIVVGLIISDVLDVNFSQKYIIKGSKDVAICIAFLVAYPLIIILLPCTREIIKRIVQNKKWWGVPAVIYGTDSSADIIFNRLLKNRYLGYHPAILVDSACTEPTEKNGILKMPPCEQVYELVKKYNLKAAILCDYKDDIMPIMSSFRYTIKVSKYQNSFTSSQQIKDIVGMIGFASTHHLTFKSNLFLKRVLDVGLIVFFSPFILPVFLILAILVKCTSKGPIFYGHKRIGKNGKVIKCWKFRSMCIDAEERLQKILDENPEMREQWERERKFENDPRVTKFGKILRKTSLDELPQLINILLGEMSFVGPRPVTKDELEKYGKYESYVLSVLPGLSGMWQTSGRSDTSYEDRIMYDTYYIQNWSIWLDLWILIKTVWVVLKGKGAY